MDANLYVGLVLRPQDFLGGLLEGVRPIPGVRESVELRRAGFAGSLAEQDIVIRVGIKRRAFAATEWLRPRRRVEINQVNALVGKFLGVAQPLEIVAEKEVRKLNQIRLLLRLAFPLRFGEGIHLRRSFHALASIIRRLIYGFGGVGGVGLLVRPAAASTMMRAFW